MSKLITANPHYLGSASHRAWADGFEVGQKSTLETAPENVTSVTGRWWQSKDRTPFFIHSIDYEFHQKLVDNYPDSCRWLTEEDTQEFK